jgi:hypothetical protein
VKNILLLDSEGKRVAVKYFSDDWPTNASKLAYEKSVFTKTLKTNARAEGIFHSLLFHAESSITIIVKILRYVVDFTNFKFFNNLV